MSALATTTPTKGVYLPAPANFEEAWRVAQVLADSELVPKDYRNKPANCLVAMQWGADVGLSGLQAIQNIAVINGRPSVWGDMALAIVKGSQAFVNISETIVGQGDQMEAVCIVKRKGQSDTEARFSVSDAKAAGLWGKAGPWTNYPKRMLQMRARGFAIRDSFPDALRGLSIAEEAQDIPEVEINPIPASSAAPKTPDALPAYTEAQFEENRADWQRRFSAGGQTPEQLITRMRNKYTISDEMEEAIKKLAPIESTATDISDAQETTAPEGEQQ